MKKFDGLSKKHYERREGGQNIDWIKARKVFLNAWKNIEKNEHMLIDTSMEEKFLDEAVKCLNSSKEISTEDRQLVKKINNQLIHFEGQESALIYDPRQYEIIEKSLNPTNLTDFSYDLETLSKIESLYSQKQNSDELKNLIESISKNTDNPKAGLLLSLYVQKIISNPENSGYYTDTTLTEIGGKRFADTTLGIWSDDFFVTKPEDYGKNKKILMSKNKKDIENIKTFKIMSGDLIISKNSELEKSLPHIFGLIWSNDSFRKEIEKNIGISFSEYSLPEQIQIMSFLTKATKEKASELKSFSNKFGQQGFRTFLSLQQGGIEMGEKILTLGEKIPQESAHLLFKKYSEIVDQVENITDYLSESLGEKVSPELVQSVRDHLLINGKNMLSRYAKEANKCTDTECENLGKEIEEQLSSIKTSVILLSSVVKTLVEKNEFNFDDFKNIEISYDRSKLSSKNISDIYMMVEENTKQYPEKLREYWRSTAIKGLQNPEPNEMLIYVKNKEDILSFMRVTPQPDGSFYGGSFNINPLLQGSRIGTEFMKKVIDQFTETGDFNADVWSDNPMLKNYIEKFNFEENGEDGNYHDTGAKIKKIIRRKQANQS